MSCDLKNETCGYSCTGYDGSKVWAKFHAIPKEVECEVCRDHTKSGFSGYHDLVNAGLGKKVFDKTNFNKFADEVECVRNKCRADGRC